MSAIEAYPEFFSPKYVESLEYQTYVTEEPLDEYLSMWQPGMRQHVAYLHYVSWVWAKELNKRSPLNLAIVDDPIYFAPLIRYLALKGIPIVAHCHNVESLSRSQLIPDHQMELLRYEIDLLSLCSLAVTISREETVFLQNLGIKTFFLPYYPVGDTLVRLHKIRERRMASEKSDFLMLGTADNPPTMTGMKEVIARWNEISQTMNGARLFVAGFGTEPLRTSAGDGVIYKGSLSNEELDEMLCDIKAAIVYQGDGAGALTKLSEFLLAGVPVLANSHAARSYYNTQGLVEFADIHNIAGAAMTVDASTAEVPLPSPPDSNALLSRIREIADAGGVSTEEVKRFVENIMSPDKRPASTETMECVWKKMTKDAIEEQTSASRSMLARITEARDELVTERDALREERNALATERDSLLASLSWRLTAPLRYIGKYFIRSHQ